MKYFRTKGHVGPDGRVVITAPAEFANEDVLVVLESTRRVLTPQEWADMLRRTAGSLPDFPDVERPGPDAFPPQESID